jgi:glycerate kinase
MKILIAPAPYKGSMTASKAASCIAAGLREALPNAQLIILPVADGGEGTVEALVAATGGRMVHQKVDGPLGDTVEASYGLCDDGTTAVIEMAAACGLSLLHLDARNPLLTSSYGAGQMIADAAGRGVRRVILGVGGSATVDGGVGLAQALGIRFSDEYGEEVRRGGQGLLEVVANDASHMLPAIRDIEFLVACDVNNPLLGAQGAAQVYGPQKGATAEMIMVLEKGLANVCRLLEQQCGRELATVPGAGAGGGLLLPLLAFARTRIEPGSEIVLTACQFTRWLSGCDLVITGEGRLDNQSVFGKAPVGVAREAKKQNIPVIALAGSIGNEAQAVHREGITAFISALHVPVKESDLAERGPVMLKESARELGYILKLAGQLRKGCDAFF